VRLAATGPSSPRLPTTAVMMCGMTTNPVEMSRQERISFLEGVLDELRPRHAAGTLVTGGREALMLWEATVDAFVDGNWVAALLCAQATCERILGGGRCRDHRTTDRGSAETGCRR
jgi:hypothetical protein